MAVDYRITIKGHLDQHWSAWFEGLAITYSTNGETILSGPLEDQAALYGTLIKIRDLGLSLISVMPAVAATR
jgi:hypothetical protein